MFSVGDKVVHPMHGAGIIEGIVQKKIGGAVCEFYIMKLPNRSMVVMIPTEGCEEIGVRSIMTPEELDQILNQIPTLQISMTSNWNHRYRENMERLKSGNLLEVARVIKGLSERDTGRGLSTGERKMLHSAKQILVSEIVLSREITQQEGEAVLDAALV